MTELLLDQYRQADPQGVEYYWQKHERVMGILRANPNHPVRAEVEELSKVDAGVYDVFDLIVLHVNGLINSQRFHELQAGAEEINVQAA